MKGTWQNDSIENIEKMAKKYLDNPAWVQVGYNPERQSSFYLRENETINGQEFEKGTPLSSADEVIQVGAFVLAKNVTTKATPSLTIGDVTLKYSKKQGIDEKTKTEGKRVGNAKKGDVKGSGRVDQSIKASKAFHGAPATFDKFRTSKIGGVNVYGWGLYFTNDKGLAEVYASQVPEGWAKKDTKKRVYEVSLAPKEVDYMDWELPLRKQSKVVKKGINEILKTLSPESPLKRWFRLNMGKMTGKDFYQWITYTFKAKNKKDFMEGAAVGKVYEKKASLYLLSKGIRGNRTTTTRSDNRPTVVNKVIFSEGDIKIDAMYSKRLMTAKKLETEWKTKIKGGEVAPPDLDQLDQSIKASKRLDTPFDKELQKAEGKAEVAPPEKKEISQKDKVTISKEARDIMNSKPTKADLTYESISNPDGNIKTSKILASRAANFALNTVKSGDKEPLRYRIAKKLTQGITPQGKLPERLKFLALRRLTKGKIQAIEEGTKTLYKVLRNTKQSSVIYDFFTTRDADPKKITNPAERKAAVDAKKTIDGIGQDLVNSGLLDAGAVAELKGMYLPNVYLKYLIPDKNSFVRVRKGGGVNVDQNYLKKRLTEEQLPKPIADLILGKIKDPAYLASKGISIPAKDMAILDFLQQIAGNEKWVSKDSMVKFDTLKEIKNAGLPLDQQKELGLIDTSGVNVSAHWLKNEAERIWNMTKYMNLDDTSRGIIEKVVKRMEDVAAPQLDKNYDSNVYTMVPKTKKYGMLAGMALRKEIAEDIFGNMDMTTGPISVAEKIIGDGGYLGDFNRFWKWSKVSANPPSWVRNFTSNMILMNMGGVSFLSMPKLIVESLGEMKNKGGINLLARDLGLTAGNFSNVELARIEREFKDLQVRLSKDGKGGPLKVFGMIKGAFNKVQDVTSDTYGGIDTLGKVMMLKDALKKSKLKVKKLEDYTPKERQQLDDIAYNAEKWLFDYSNVLPSVKYLRNVPFGAPFASFTSFVAPLMLETAITKPWKFLPYYALGYAMKEMFKDEFELDEEQYEGFKVSMSEYLREKAYNSIFPRAVVPFPFLDENKRIQFMDVSYLYPWGMFSEVAGELGQGKVGDAIKTAGLLGSPGLTIASAIMTGIDPFSRREIVDETGTPSEKAADLLWYAFNLSAPPMLHGLGQGPGQGFGAVKRLVDAHTGQLSKDGEAKFTKGQAWGRMFGMNVTPIAVPEGRTKHLKYEYSKLKKLEYTAKREIKNMIVMQASKKDIQEVIKEYAEKIGEAKKEFIEKIRISAPPMNLLRNRETFLKKQRQKALTYNSS